MEETILIKVQDLARGLGYKQSRALTNFCAMKGIGSLKIIDGHACRVVTAEEADQIRARPGKGNRTKGGERRGRKSA